MEIKIAIAHFLSLNLLLNIFFRGYKHTCGCFLWALSLKQVFQIIMSNLRKRSNKYHWKWLMREHKHLSIRIVTYGL